MDKNLLIFILIGLQNFCLAQVCQQGGDEDCTLVVGIVGGSVTLKCDLPKSDPAQIAWKDNVWNNQRGKEPIFNSSESLSIASTHIRKDFMSVDKDYKLTIQNLLSGKEEDNEYETSSSGDYYCYSLYGGKWLEQKFFLTLVGKPECSGVTDLHEGETSSLSCSVNYYGEAPILEWYRNGQLVEDARDESGFDDDTLLAKVTAEVTQANDKDDEAIYTCRSKISDEVEECTLRLSVQYPVRDIKLEPESDVIHLGQEIRCRARGNPAPKLKFDPETESVFHGKGHSKMNVDKNWLNKITTVKCTAENSLDGRVEIVEKSITFNTTVPVAEEVGGNAIMNKVSLLIGFMSLIVTLVL